MVKKALDNLSYQVILKVRSEPNLNLTEKFVFLF